MMHDYSYSAMFETLCDLAYWLVDRVNGLLAAACRHLRRALRG